jgi:hypothetical protein
MLDLQKNMAKDQITRSFSQVYGKPCWGVKRGYGSFLTFEFGRPHLVIHEPRRTADDVSPRVRKALARRLVVVHGDGHLWIYCCDWVVRDGGKVIGDSSNVRRIDRAAAFLDGQKLLSISLRARGARTWFGFDLGGELETVPFDRTSEQWSLYEPTGKVLALRADRCISYVRNKTRPNAERWRKVAGFTL